MLAAVAADSEAGVTTLVVVTVVDVVETAGDAASIAHGFCFSTSLASAAKELSTRRRPGAGAAHCLTQCLDLAAATLIVPTPSPPAWSRLTLQRDYPKVAGAGM